MNNIYEIVGHIIEMVQNIEYNLCQKIKYNKLLYLFEKNKHVSPYLFSKVEEETKTLVDDMSNMTFGQVIGIVRKFDALSNDDIEYLESILSKRNQLVHRYFKYSELNKSSDEAKERYLLTFLKEATTFNQYLENIVNDTKNDLDKNIYRKDY